MPDPEGVETQQTHCSAHLGPLPYTCRLSVRSSVSGQVAASWASLSPCLPKVSRPGAVMHLHATSMCAHMCVKPRKEIWGGPPPPHREPVLRWAGQPWKAQGSAVASGGGWAAQGICHSQADSVSTSPQQEIAEEKWLGRQCVYLAWGL